MFFGRFPAELGPETPLIGSGSKHGAEIIHNYPQGPILRPFRDHVLIRTNNQNLKCVTKRRLVFCKSPLDPDVDLFVLHLGLTLLHSLLMLGGPMLSVDPARRVLALAFAFDAVCRTSLLR